jgi:hypothetical protein
MRSGESARGRAQMTRQDDRKDGMDRVWLAEAWHTLYIEVEVEVEVPKTCSLEERI